MEKNKLSFGAYEEVLWFMVESAKKYREKALKQDTAEEKLKYFNKEEQILTSHWTLLSLTREAQDFYRTGNFEVSRIL